MKDSLCIKGIPEDVKKDFKIYCDNSGVTMSALLRSFIVNTVTAARAKRASRRNPKKP